MRLKDARVACGLSQRELARLAGTCQTEISKLELGQRQLSVRWALRLATPLGVRPSDLLQGEIIRENANGTRTLQTYDFDLSS